MNKRPSNNKAALIEAAILKRSGKGSVSITQKKAPSPNENDTKETTDQTILSLEDGIGNNTNSDGCCRDNKEDEGFEYLDHTADIQLHSWGTSLSSCLVQLIKCMFGYMTCNDLVEIDQEMSLNIGTNIIAQGHDWKSLVYSFMDEWLFVFHDTGFVIKELEIASIDRDTFSIVSHGKGEKIDLRKHTQGTEVKAITYSNMKISETEDRCDIWVIVDI